MPKRPPKKSPARKQRRQSAAELRPGELLTHVFLIAMLGVFALFTFDQKYMRMDASKYTFLAYAVAFTAFAFLLLFVHTVVTKRRTLLSPDGPILGALRSFSALDYAAAAFFLVAFISMLASRDPKLAFGGGSSRYEGFLVMLMYAFIYFIVSRFYTHRAYILLVFAACASLVSLIGLLQFYGCDILRLNETAPIDARPFGGTFQTTLGNVNIVSTFVSFAIPMFSVLYIKTESRLRFAYLAAALLCWYQEMMASSDSGFVGLAAAFVLLLPFIVTDITSLKKMLIVGSGALFAAFAYSAIAKEQVENRGISKIIMGLDSKLLVGAFIALGIALGIHFLIEKGHKAISPKAIRRAAAAVSILCIAAALFVGWIYPVQADSGFLYEYTQAMRGNMDDTFGSFRGFVWTRSLKLFGTLPFIQKLVGVGPGMFGDAFGAAFREESLAVTGVYYDRAHNEYIQTLITLGVLGLLAYLAILFTSLARAWRHKENPVALALGAAMLCFFAQAFFNFSVTIVTPFFWVFLGMLANQAPRLGGGFLGKNGG